ncbi:class A beta-lactamase-related serine hydrolase [Roseofilum sp. BLCC_M91]|uniref:Class A beta-lactamase-related serine hydrolase n=1 Tax=Roseofilum halophilum BLCC-M91 TaxID=3022259 RepID=A0ABT7BNF2_9CYAN|nr:serine hydrolase [Roseofilum halophilum]MDJ1180722.1 class A beta-lactamase-related serine hydrolase [Roseofilum halophilum BLCC-M91]
MAKSGARKGVDRTQRLGSAQGITHLPKQGSSRHQGGMSLPKQGKPTWKRKRRSPLQRAVLSVLDKILPGGKSDLTPQVNRGRSPRSHPASPIPPLKVENDPLRSPVRLGSRKPQRKSPLRKGDLSSVAIPKTLSRQRSSDRTRQDLSKIKSQQKEQLEKDKVRSPRNRRDRPLNRPEPTPVSPLMYATRFLIMGVGICAIAGTLLSASDPESMTFLGLKLASTDSLSNQVNETPDPSTSETTDALLRERVASQNPWLTAPHPLHLETDLQELKNNIQALASQTPRFKPGVFVLDLDTSSYVDVEGTTVFSAASTIKLPILLAFFQAVDAGQIRLDETLTLKEEHLAGGSGSLQYDPVGSEYTALEVATWMMTISDNTATNMIIERLGGMSQVNQSFSRWGLKQTVIRDWLPDLEGKNTTSPRELAQVMAMIHQGDVVSLKSRDRMINIMRQTETSVLLEQGLGSGATIAHKTGDIGKLLGDVALIDLPSGKRYIAAVLVERPHNDYGAADLIGDISRLTYEQMQAPPVTPSVTPGTLEELPVDFPEATARRYR